MTLRKRAKRMPAASAVGYRLAKGFTTRQAERHRGMPPPPAPFEQVEARRGPGRKRKPRNRGHGRPRGR